MRGVQLCVEASELPDLDEGEFYACDVEGAKVSSCLAIKLVL